jgi:hypothetical protein
LGYAAHCYTWTAWWHVGGPAEEEVTYEEVDSSFAEVDEAKCQVVKNMENCSPSHSSGIEKYPLPKDFKAQGDINFMIYGENSTQCQPSGCCH